MASTDEVVAPAKEAIRQTHLLDAAFGETTPFRVDVVEPAKAVGSQLRLRAEIPEAQAANLRSFEGGLFEV